MATQYEQRTIGGSSYNVPVGLRSDWQPGQAYNMPTQTVTTPTQTQAPTAQQTPTQQPATNHIPNYSQPAQTGGQVTQAPSSFIPSTPVAQPVQKEPWQIQLESYSNPANYQTAMNEIARAGQVYNQKMAAGDTAGAQQAHVWANQIRDALGMQNFNRETGASLSPQTVPQQIKQPEQPEVLPWWQKEKFEQPASQQENPYQGQMQNILGQLQQQVNQPFSYDPQSDPAYQSMVDNASRTVMEQMNQRGILASTVTRDSVAQAISPIISQLMEFAYNRQQGQVTNLMNLLGQTNTLENQQYQRTQETENLAYERQRQEYLDQIAAEKQALETRKQKVEEAIKMIETFGSVTNEASILLGVPVEAKPWEVIKFAQEQLVQIEMKKAEIDSAMQRAQLSAATSRSNNASSNAASMARTQYTQGQINSRSTNQSASMKDIIAMAQRDPGFDSATEGEKQQIIDYYAGLMGVGQGDSGGGGTTDVDIYNQAMPQYFDAISNGEVSLRDVYSEIDGYMQSGQVSSNLGEIMKAKLREQFE